MDGYLEEAGHDVTMRWGRSGGHTVPSNWARKLAGCLRVEELRGGSPPTQPPHMPPQLPPPAAPSPATPAGDECAMLEEAEGADVADGADDAWCASCELCSSYCPGCDPELSWESYEME